MKPTTPKPKAERVQLPSQTAGWASTAKAAKYCDISVRLLRDWLKHGLRHAKIGGSIRIAYADLDLFLRSHEVDADAELHQIAAIVNNVMVGLK